MEVSISFTTYGNKIKFAERSLYYISLWKNENQQLLVSCHDASLEMKKLLIYYKQKKIINNLFFTPNNYGHLRGVNLCLKKAEGNFFFNINHDVLIKKIDVIESCKSLLEIEKNGMIGWFWVGNGCYWKDEKLICKLRKKEIKNDATNDDPFELKKALEKNKIKITSNWIWCCNTSFFGIKTKLFKEIGGFNTKDFKHGYADDYLTYQLLEKKINVIDLPRHIYDNELFESTTRCKLHDIGLKLAKKESRPFEYLVKFI